MSSKTQRALAAPAPLRIMTYNVLSPEDGLKRLQVPWATRKPAIVNLINASINKPDVLGIQEATGCPAADCGTTIHPSHEIAAALDAEYDYYPAIGTPSLSPKMIFWRQSRLRAVAGRSGYFNFRGFPAGSSYRLPECENQLTTGERSSRTVTWVLLEEIATGEKYFVMNTHLFSNPSGVNCWRYRNQAVSDIKSRINEQNPEQFPVVVMGDFNDLTPGCTTASDGGAVLKNLSQQTGWFNLELDWPGSDCTKPTTNAGFDTNLGNDKSKLDYIAYSAGFTPVAQRVDTTMSGSHSPSDHYPVILRLQPNPQF